jgi:hypothetical protein
MPQKDALRRGRGNTGWAIARRHYRIKEGSDGGGSPALPREEMAERLGGQGAGSRCAPVRREWRRVPEACNRRLTARRFGHTPYGDTLRP